MLTSFISAVPRTILTGASASGPKTTWLRVQGTALRNPPGGWEQRRGNWDYDIGRFLGCLSCSALHPVESRRGGHSMFFLPSHRCGFSRLPWEGEEELLRSSYSLSARQTG